MNNAQRLLPPHSIESEQSVLGGLMLDNDRWDDIATIVSADNFYVRPHQLIFNAMHDLLMQGKPVDLITLSELLWSSFFGHADQMVGLCTGGQLGGRA
ncbi:DnaB-like helicase N-terminal domain-containing protein, partial [Klebsiella sp. 103027]|uniref:DnaB-like helicase N-terminal domain-containing protein n=1 Tax=Klebsiella sp. 103027 TaxID=3079190 RepID=UPI0030071678